MALVVNVGAYLASGTYEVIWSVYLDRLGAGLDLIGLTFALFGLPVVVLSPAGGRLVDRRGARTFAIVGAASAVIAGLLYAAIAIPVWFIPVVLFEGTGFALMTPAVFAMVAAGSPSGRSSTAQGVFGAAGTVGTIVAATTAGFLAEIDLRLPFWVFSAVMAGLILLAMAMGWRAMGALRPLPTSSTSSSAAGVQ